MVPDHWVSAESGRRSIFTVMADHGHRAINLVFNDKYMASPEDLATNDGTEVDLEGTMAALKESLVETDFESVLKDTLLLDGEPKRAQLTIAVCPWGSRTRIKPSSVFVSGMQLTLILCSCVFPRSTSCLISTSQPYVMIRIQSNG